MTSQPNIGGINNLAIASLILAILCVVLGPLGSIPAIICGHLALKGYRNANVAEGTGMAKVGLWIGYIGLFIFILVAAVVIKRAQNFNNQSDQIFHTIDNLGEKN